MENINNIWSCYDCEWATDKCKCKNCNQYDRFLADIEKCDLIGNVDNTLGSSWKTIGKEL